MKTKITLLLIAILSLTSSCMKDHYLEDLQIAQWKAEKLQQQLNALSLEMQDQININIDITDKLNAANITINDLTDNIYRLDSITASQAEEIAIHLARIDTLTFNLNNTSLELNQTQTQLATALEATELDKELISSLTSQIVVLEAKEYEIIYEYIRVIETVFVHVDVPANAEAIAALETEVNTLNDTIALLEAEPMLNVTPPAVAQFNTPVNNDQDDDDTLSVDAMVDNNSIVAGQTAQFTMNAHNNSGPADSIVWQIKRVFNGSTEFVDWKEGATVYFNSSEGTHEERAFEFRVVAVYDGEEVISNTIEFYIGTPELEVVLTQPGNNIKVAIHGTAGENYDYQVIVNGHTRAHSTTSLMEWEISVTNVGGSPLNDDDVVRVRIVNLETLEAAFDEITANVD